MRQQQGNNQGQEGQHLQEPSVVLRRGEEWQQKFMRLTMITFELIKLRSH